MPTPYHSLPEHFPHSPYAAACAAEQAMGDQWQVFPGPWGVTGHLFNSEHTPFTVGVCEAGSLYIRNDERGDSIHVPVNSHTPLTKIGQTIAELINDLF
ncbi:hypothetical protein [Streptomyces bobili]|uniref:hypothetical protein n=1 Tax=Streptomyces bobili TaxID=67280 RepID=UPI0037207AAB